MPHQCLKCGVLFNEGTTTILRGCPECRGTRFFYTQKPLTMTEREKLLATSEISLREAIEQLVKKAKDGDVSDLPRATDEWVKIATPPSEASTTPKRLEDFQEPPAPVEAAKPVKFTPAPPPPADVPIPVIREAPKRDVWWLPGNKLLIKRTQEDAPPKRPRKQQIEFDYAPPPAPVLQTPPAFTPVPEKEKPVAKPEQKPVTAPPVEEPPATHVPTAEEIPIPAEGPPETIRISKPGEYEIDVKRLLESNPIVIQRDGTYLIHLASLFEANRPRDD